MGFFKTQSLLKRDRVLLVGYQKGLENAHISSPTKTASRAIMITIVVSFFVLLPMVTSLLYPEDSLSSHPFYTDPRFKTLSKTPAVLQKYSAKRRGIASPAGIRFLPMSATYTTFLSRRPFATNVDALYISSLSSIPKDVADPNFLSVKLNSAARVILLLVARGMRHQDLRNIKTIQGLGSEWTQPTAVRAADNMVTTYPRSDRLRNAIHLPRKAVAVQANLIDGKMLVLPHPRTLSINNKTVVRYTLLFAQSGNLDVPLIPFPYQVTPPLMQSAETGVGLPLTAPEPNETCPPWLHDLYIVSSRDADTARAQGEPYVWRTWHPPIDQFYWCYFTHEHGSFPGKYRPMLGYTAWKTPDGTTVHGRQDESNEGFKVFAIPLHDQNKFVVFTVHMHLAKARRFAARHHTVIVAVLDDKWNIEMEVHMKADFGFAFASGNDTVGNRRIPLTETDELIRRELRSKRFKASRRFNVLNLDNYPDAVDSRFRLRLGISPTPQNKPRVAHGVYERWSTPLNTCTRSTGKVNRGILFDVRDPATAKKYFEGESHDIMQMLTGSSVNRVLIVKKGMGSFEIGANHCSFFATQDLKSSFTNEGLFYTDPYFQELREKPGKDSVRQFMSNDFRGISMRPGKLVPTDAWSGHYEYIDENEHVTQRFINTEGGVKASDN